MKISTIVGARPQFIKAKPVCDALRLAGHQELIIHTGQHYDYGMSQIFFDELGIPKPDVNLGIGSGAHGKQTGEMLTQIEALLMNELPDWLLVYGDTNSTLAGTLAAIKLKIPVAHVEAGLRSFNRDMPEEHNRVLTDHASDLLFCPTQTAVGHLSNEGITKGVHFVGDTMYDAVLQFTQRARETSTILQSHNLDDQRYYLATVHRPYNTDVPENLQNILEAFCELDVPVVLPIHPRTRKKIDDFGLSWLASGSSSLRLIDPVGYLDMLQLLTQAALLFTDSGGMQKEAYFLETPCITLRPETEWVETVQSRWNVLVSADKQKIIETAATRVWPDKISKDLFGDGNAAASIVQIVEN